VISVFHLLDMRIQPASIHGRIIDSLASVMVMSMFTFMIIPLARDRTQSRVERMNRIRFSLAHLLSILLICAMFTYDRGYTTPLMFWLGLVFFAYVMSSLDWPLPEDDNLPAKAW
jgi:lysylphosphatidylglycerol synthetase-like protein (DUF2156 family)